MSAATPLGHKQPAPGGHSCTSHTRSDQLSSASHSLFGPLCRNYRVAVDTDRTTRIRADIAAEDAELQRQWDACRESLDSLGPEVAAECRRRRRGRVRLEGLLAKPGWVFEISTEQHPGAAVTCMHVAFHQDGAWTLLGYHNGRCARPVDKTAPLHPGLRQGFVFDAKRHEAEVVFMLSRQQLRDTIFEQIREG